MTEIPKFGAHLPKHCHDCETPGEFPAWPPAELENWGGWIRPYLCPECEPRWTQWLRNHIAEVEAQQTRAVQAHEPRRPDPPLIVNRGPYYDNRDYKHMSAIDRWHDEREWDDYKDREARGELT